MELRQLRYFAVLAEELNFTARRRAAHLPAAAQPADRAAGARAGREAVRPQQSPRRADRGRRGLPERRARHAGAAQDATVRARGGPGPGRPHRDRPVGIALHGAGAGADRALPAHALAGVGAAERDEPGGADRELRGHRIDLSISRTRVDDEELQSQPLWPDPVAVALPAGHRLAAQAAGAGRPGAGTLRGAAPGHLGLCALAGRGLRPRRLHARCGAERGGSAGPAGAGGGGAGRGAGAGIRLSPDGRPHRGVRAARRAVAGHGVRGHAAAGDAAARWTVSCRPPRRAARASGTR